MNHDSSRDILVVAPHPDDETLGCAGTLLRHSVAGDRIHWLIATQMSVVAGYGEERVLSRKAEIAQVEKEFCFSSVHQFDFEPARLDEVPKKELIESIAGVFDTIRPDWVYLPDPADAHSDHYTCFEAASACLKWFRRPFVKRIMSYEVPSETGFGLDPRWAPFVPNVYVAIDEQISRKLEILSIYAAEIGQAPFPRSVDVVKALALKRGSECGAKAAEAFHLLKEHI